MNQLTVATGLLFSPTPPPIHAYQGRWVWKGKWEGKSEKDYINWEKVRDRLTTNYDDVYIYYIYILNIRDACSVPYVSFFLRHVTTVSAITFTVYTSIYYYYSWVVLCCWATKEMKNIKVYSLFLLLLSSDQVSDKTFFFFANARIPFYLSFDIPVHDAQFLFCQRRFPFY
jgi:hypothetical protein